MRAVAVVALAIVLDHQLPVGLLDDARFDGDLDIVHAVGLEVVLEGHQEIVDRRWMLGQADEDEAAGGAHVDRLEAIGAEIEIAAHVAAGEQQPTVELVGPLMVGADQLGELALVLDAQARATVATDIMEGVHLAFGATHHDHRVVADLHGHEVALGGDFAGHGGEQPLLGEDLLHVQCEQSGVVVERLGQREVALPLVEQVGGGLLDGGQGVVEPGRGDRVHAASSYGASPGRRTVSVGVSCEM